MMRPTLALFLALSLSSVLAEETDVVVGNKDNFEKIIGDEGLVLVKFFAPWCGHCKSMAADFKEAATELKGRATLVDLDATEEKDLAEKYGVRGFPTLKLFSKGELISDYKGGRTKDALVSYIERAMLPSVVECATADDVTKFVADNPDKALVIGVALKDLEIEFKKTSMSLRDSLPDAVAFAFVADSKLLAGVTDAEVADGAVVVVREDKTSDVFSGEPADLEKWAKTVTLPVFAELSRDNAGSYTELESPIVMLFQDPASKDDDVNTVMKEVATSFRSADVAFVWINSIELKSFAEHVGVADMSPAIAAYTFKSDTKFVFPGKFSAETFSAWVQELVDGKLSATTKSEPVPEKNDEPVKTIVGDSFEDIVMDESKDVLIEQYAPWCGHCKKLAPVLDDLAAKLAGVDTLVIAKMDATKNDAPADYKAQGYPTLHFFPAGSKKGVSYDGGRTVEDFVKYFKENAKHKEGIELPESDDSSTEGGDEKEDAEDKEEL